MERMKEFSAGEEDDDQGPENTEDETNSSTPTKLSTCLLCLLCLALLAGSGKNNN